MILDESYTLNNGLTIPKLGLGTWMIANDIAKDAVLQAINNNYRLIDTAQAYKNEEGIGKALNASNIRREQIFLTDKVAAEHKTYESTLKSIDDSLAKLNTPYIDLMLIHSPQPWAEFRSEKRYFKENKAVWRALEDAKEAGKIKAIGVSNFLKDDLENILEDCKIKPAVNQVLTHIGNTPLNLIDFCKANNILVEAYSPIAHGEILNNKEIAAIANKYNATIAQLCLRYVIELQMVALPKASNLEHMIENTKIEFDISSADMEYLTHCKTIDNYGRFSSFPVFSGK